MAQDHTHPPFPPQDAGRAWRLAVCARPRGARCTRRLAGLAELYWVQATARRQRLVSPHVTPRESCGSLLRPCAANRRLPASKPRRVRSGWLRRPGFGRPRPSAAPTHEDRPASTNRPTRVGAAEALRGRPNPCGKTRRLRVGPGFPPCTATLQGCARASPHDAKSHVGRRCSRPTYRMPVQGASSASDRIQLGE
jgi:hypothetical protein